MDSTVLSWRGDMDLGTAQHLQAEFEALADTLASAHLVILDLSAVRYLDSVGLGALVHARNVCAGQGLTLVLRAIPPRVRRMLALTGLTPLFLLEDASVVGSLPTRPHPQSTELPPEPDPVFDQIAALTRRVIGVPTALVSLVDRTRQVFPGAVGLPDPWQEARCTPLTHSFCQYVVIHEKPLVVSDATTDPILAHNLAVDDLSVVAYAGVPLTDVDGAVVGSLCAIDSVEREWTDLEIANLTDLAAVCSAELHKRGSAQRAAVSADRDRIARDVHADVVKHLFAATMTLGQARGLTTGRADDLVGEAIDTIDHAIATIRRTIFNAPPERPPAATE